MQIIFSEMGASLATLDSSSFFAWLGDRKKMPKECDKTYLMRTCTYSKSRFLFESPSCQYFYEKGNLYLLGNLERVDQTISLVKSLFSVKTIKLVPLDAVLIQKATNYWIIKTKDINIPFDITKENKLLIFSLLMPVISKILENSKNKGEKFLKIFSNMTGRLNAFVSLRLAKQIFDDLEYHDEICAIKDQSIITIDTTGINRYSYRYGFLRLDKNIFFSSLKHSASFSKSCRKVWMELTKHHIFSF